MAIDPVKPKLSLGQIAEQTPVEMNEFSNAGKTLNFSAKNADRYLTYGSKAYGQLGYNPYRDNESKYQQETPWTKDISRGFNGMIKLAGVGMSDSFAFGAFGSEENHKDFGKIMSDYGSRRGGATEFWANTQLSAGYTVGIIASVAAEELLLAAATFLSGAASASITAPLMAAEATRAGSLLSKLGRGIAQFDSKIGKLAKLRNIEDARMFHSTVAGFGKALLPFGNTADFLRMFKPAETIGKDMAVAAANFKNLNGLTKTVMGAAALSRDARKIYLSHSESKLEANFVKDEIYDDAIKKWQIAHPGESISRKDNDFILAKSQAAYDKTYTTNFGLIYITNAITFEGLFKGFSPTNTLFRSIDNFGISGIGFRNVSIKSLAPSIKSYVTKKLSSITLPGVIKASVQASMEGVQEYGQDIIASAAKKYGVIEFEDLGFERDIKGKLVYKDKYNEEGKKIGKEKIPVFGNVKRSAKNMSLGAYWNDVSNSLGDSKFSTFASGALMGVFASPVNMATKVASEYSFGERGFGSEYNAWSAEGRKKYSELWKQREESAEIMTQLFQSQGASFEVDINATSHRMIGLREQMLEAGRTGDQKIFEDKKTEIFQLGMRELFKNGMEKELIDHLNQMSGYSAKELNESLDRLDITEDNKADFFEKIEKRKADISSLKKEYDRINLEMPSKGNVDSVLRDSTLTGDQKQERVLEIIAWDSLKEQMLFAGDKIRNFAERKKGIANNLKDNSKLTDTEISALTNREDLKEQIKLLEEQVASNKEYKMDDTKDHQKALIKLNALKDLQKGFISLDASTKETSESDINDIYLSMEDSFGRYMLAVNTELNSIPNESSLASDKNLYSRYTRKFKDLFDLYQITDEQKELEYYADMLNNPKSSAKWLEARKAFLIEVGNNKKAYIKSSIESWQERETSDAMLAELLDNGIIFELDELDDLLDKGVMPSKLYDVDTNNEVTSEKYDLAVKIIGKKYKSLTGKKIKGYKGSKDLGARAKAKGDKRKASGLLNAYAGKNKLNEPITVKDFINKLLAKGNTYLTKSEIALLEKFSLLPFTNNVILTDTADGPISFNEAGDLVLDIRFGASDYVMAELPFEYVAISGLVQNIFSKKIEENQEFVSDITSMMNEAKQAYIARIVDEEKDTTSATQQISDITSSSLFNNALVFIVESFTNKDFQLVLASIESDVDATNASIWKDLNRTLRLELGGDIKGTMLDQVLGIAQLSLSESEIEEVVESPTVAEQETEEDVTETEEEVTEEEEVVIEEPEEEIVLPTSTIEERITKKKEIQTRIKKLRKDVEGLETRKTKTSSLKFRSIFIIKKEIDNINIEVDGLLKEYERLEAIDKVVATTDTVIVPESNTAINQVDDAGQTIINSFSKFDTLPEELQYLLAKKYYISIGKATPPMRELLDELTDDIIQSIEDNMHLPSFIDVIGQFNSNKPTSTVEIVDEEETEDDDLSLILFSDAAEKEFKATRERAYAGIMDAAIGGVTTTFVNHLGVEETINADSDISLRKIIADTYAIDGWANNTNNILGKTFKALVGDVVTEVEILIEKVKILPSGMIHVIALRTDNKEGKYYDMYVNPINGVIRSHRNNIGKISTLNDRFDLIIGFFGSIIEPFDPAVKSTRSSIKSTAPKFNIFTTAQEIKNEYVGIEDFFTDAELEIISTELSNITDAKAFASYLEDIGEALEQRRINKKKVAPTVADTKIETTDFENKVENIKSNWGLLVAEQGYRYTGNDPRLRKKYKSDKDDYRLWTINQKDIDYIRYSSFDLFSLPKEEFLNAVLEKLQEAEDLSKSIKTIDLNLGQSEVEKIVMDQLKYALINNIAGTKVITALNRKLSQVKSDKVIKYTILSKKGSSAVKVTTKSKSQMTKRVNKKTQLANEIGDYFTGNSDFLTEDQAKYLLYDALKTEKLHPEILGDIFSSGVTPSALKAYRSLLSNTSPFKTADGFADVFLDGMTIAFKNTWGSRANIFIELLSENTSLSEMANYFEAVYFSETGADEDYDGRLSDEDLLQLYLTSDEKNKEDNAIQIDFQSSIEYQILTGQYKGNYNDLTNEQKELYDTINPKGKVSEKKDKEEDDFMDNLPKSTAFEIQVSLFSERYQGLSNSMQIKKMIDDIERATSINDIILIYSVVNNPLGKYSTDQKIIINNRIQTRVSVFQDVLLNEGVVTVELRSIDLGNGIILPAGTYMLQSNMTLSPNIGLRITEIKNNIPYTVNVLDLMGAVENIYEPGESINSQTLNLSLTNEDNETIKASIKNIFSNFNSNVSEFESIPDEELIAQINNEFNNCK
jgi:hypothetical protein